MEKMTCRIVALFVILRIPRRNNLKFNMILTGELNKKSMVSKMCDLANKNSEWCDFAETSKNRFKTKVKEQVYKH